MHQFRFQRIWIPVKQNSFEISPYFCFPQNALPAHPNTAQDVACLWFPGAPDVVPVTGLAQEHAAAPQPCGTPIPFLHPEQPARTATAFSRQPRDWRCHCLHCYLCRLACSHLVLCIKFTSFILKCDRSMFFSLLPNKYSWKDERRRAVPPLWLMRRDTGRRGNFSTLSLPRPTEAPSRGSPLRGGSPAPQRCLGSVQPDLAGRYASLNSIFGLFFCLAVGFFFWVRPCLYYSAGRRESRSVKLWGWMVARAPRVRWVSAGLSCLSAPLEACAIFSWCTNLVSHFSIPCSYFHCGVRGKDLFFLFVLRRSVFREEWHIRASCGSECLNFPCCHLKVRTWRIKHTSTVWGNLAREMVQKCPVHRYGWCWSEMGPVVILEWDGSCGDAWESIWFQLAFHVKEEQTIWNITGDIKANVQWYHLFLFYIPTVW